MIEYKHDGDGKVFTDEGGKVKWVCECIIDNAQGVADILNDAQQKIMDAEKPATNKQSEEIICMNCNGKFKESMIVTFCLECAASDSK